MIATTQRSAGAPEPFAAPLSSQPATTTFSASDDDEGRRSGMSSVGSSSRHLSVPGCSTPGRSTDGLVACASPPTSLPAASRVGSAADLLHSPLAACAMRAQEQAALEQLAAERAAAEQNARHAGARLRGARELAALEAAKSELKSRLHAAQNQAVITQAQQRQKAGEEPRWEQVAAEIESRRHAARQLAAVEYAAREEAARQQGAQQAAARARAFQELAELQRSVTREVQQLQAEAGVVVSPRSQAISLPPQSTKSEGVMLTRDSAAAILRELEQEGAGMADAADGQPLELALLHQQPPPPLQPQPQPPSQPPQHQRQGQEPQLPQQPQQQQQHEAMAAAKLQPSSPTCAWQCMQQRPSVSGRTEEEWFDCLEECGSAGSTRHGTPQRCKAAEAAGSSKKGCCTIM